MSVADIKKQYPNLAGYTDEEVVRLYGQAYGMDLSAAAQQVGYDMPRSTAGKELVAGGNSYLNGMSSIGAVLGIPGAQGYADRAKSRADLLSEASPTVKSLDDIHGVGDLLSYAGHTAATSAPYMAEMAAYGLADYASGGALTPAILARYGTVAPRVLGGGALKAGASAVERVAAERAGEAFARSAASAAATYPSSLGDVLSNQYEQAGTYNLPAAAALAVPYAASNFGGVEGAIGGRRINALTEGLAHSRTGQALLTGAEHFTKEGAQEVFQELSNQFGRTAVDSSYDPFGAKARNAYLESFVGGGLLGAPMGAVHGALHPKVREDGSLLPGANPAAPPVTPPVAPPADPVVTPPADPVVTQEQVTPQDPVRQQQIATELANVLGTNKAGNLRLAGVPGLVDAVSAVVAARLDAAITPQDYADFQTQVSTAAATGKSRAVLRAVQAAQAAMQSAQAVPATQAVPDTQAVPEQAVPEQALANIAAGQESAPEQAVPAAALQPAPTAPTAPTAPQAQDLAATQARSDLAALIGGRLGKQQRAVLSVLDAALDAGTLDQYRGGDGTLSAQKLADAAGIANRGTAQNAINGLARVIAARHGRTVEETRAALRERGKAQRVLILSDHDLNGLSPAQQRVGVSLDEVFGSDTHDASMGIVERINDAQGDVGAAEAPPGYTDSVLPSANARAEADHAIAGRQADLAELRASPIWNNAAADWDSEREDHGNTGPTFDEMSPDEQDEWAEEYAELVNNRSTDDESIRGLYEQITRDRSESERHRAAVATKPRRAGDGGAQHGAVSALQPEHGLEPEQATRADRRDGRAGSGGGAARTVRPVGVADSGAALGARESAAVPVLGAGAHLLPGDDLGGAAGGPARRAVSDADVPPRSGERGEVARTASAATGADAAARDAQPAGAAREAGRTGDRPDVDVAAGEPPRPDSAGEHANPIEARVAALKALLGPKQVAQVDRLVARYAAGDIDLSRLNAELDNFDAQVEQKVQYSIGGGERTTPDAIRAAITPIAPARSPRIHIYDTLAQARAEHPQDAELQSQLGTRIQAWVSGQHAYFIAENIPAGSELSVFLHEVGAHLGMDRMLTADQYTDLLNKIDDWADKNDGSIECECARRARQRVEAANTREDAQDSELLAYFVEEAVARGVDPTAMSYKTELGRWFRRLYGAMRVALAKLGLVNIDRLTAQDVVDIAAGAAHIALTRDCVRTLGETATANDYRPLLVKSNYVPNAKDLYLPNGMRLIAMRDKTRDETVSEARAAAREGRSTKADPMEQDIRWPMRPENDARRLIAYMVQDDTDQPIGHALLGLTDGDIDQVANIEFYDKGRGYGRAVVGALLALNPQLDLHWVKNERAADSWYGIGATTIDDGGDGTITREEFDDRLKAKALTVSDANGSRPRRTATGDTGAATARLPELSDLAADAGGRGADDTGGGVQGAAGGSVSSEARLDEDEWDRYFGERRRSISAPAAPDAGGGAGAPDAGGIRDLSGAARASNARVAEALHRLGENSKSLGGQAVKWLSFTHDIAARAAKLFAAAPEYFATLNQKWRAVRITEERLQGVGDQYAGLSLAERRAVCALIYDSTFSKRAWAFQPDWLAPVSVDAGLAGRYQALSGAAQGVVRDVFKFNADERRARHALTNDTIKRELQALIDTKAAALAALPAGTTDTKTARELMSLKKELAGRQSAEVLPAADLATPYAPLVRFGDFLAVAKSDELIAAERADDAALVRRLKEDPAHYDVSFHASQGKAVQAARELSRRFGAVGKNVYYGERLEVGKKLQDVSFVTYKRLMKRLADLDTDSTGSTSKPVAAMQDALSRLYIQSLEDDNARRADLHRAYITGADPLQMMRGFFARGIANAHMLATLKYHDALSDSQARMRAEAAGRIDDKVVERRAMMNHIERLYEAALEHKDGPLNTFQNALMRVNSVWRLLTSPAYMFMNAVQPALYTVPYMSGRHGYTRSLTHNLRAYSDLASGIQGGTFRPDTLADASERDMVKSLLSAGLIDISLNSEIGEWLEAGETRFSNAKRQVFRKLTVLPHMVELANRVTGALAAYRMEKAKLTADNATRADPMTADAIHAAAIAYATDVVQTTHGDYGAGNAPLLFRKMPKALLQFRKFQLIQIAVIVKLANQMFRGASREDKRAALKGLSVMLGSTLALAGTAGLPAGGLILSALAGVFGPPDDPDDEDAVRRAIGDKGLSDLLLHGLPTLGGLDLTNRLGMGNVTSLLPYARDGHGLREQMQNYALSAMGPSLGLALTWADGATQMLAGNYWKGVESMIPSGPRDVLRSIRFADDGLSNARGELLLTPEQVGPLGWVSQALGLPPMSVTEAYRVKSAAYATEQHIADRATQLQSDYIKAVRAGDDAAASGAREAWREMQDSARALGLKPQPLSTLLKAPANRTKRERGVVGGVMTNKGDRAMVAGMLE